MTMTALVTSKSFLSVPFSVTQHTPADADYHSVVRISERSATPAPDVVRDYLILRGSVATDPAGSTDPEDAIRVACHPVCEHCRTAPPCTGGINPITLGLKAIAIRRDAAITGNEIQVHTPIESSIAILDPSVDVVAALSDLRAQWGDVSHMTFHVYRLDPGQGRPELDGKLLAIPVAPDPGA